MFTREIVDEILSAFAYYDQDPSEPVLQALAGALGVSVGSLKGRTDELYNKVHPDYVPRAAMAA